MNLDYTYHYKKHVIKTIKGHIFNFSKMFIYIYYYTKYALQDDEINPISRMCKLKYMQWLYIRSLISV